MDLSRAVSEFVKCGSGLFRLLQSEGESISRVDLHLLLTQLFILQIEARGLARRVQPSDHDRAEQAVDTRSPSITAMAAYLQVGDRLRAIGDHYPARSGAIGRIRCFKGMPESWYVVIEWEKPWENFAREKTTNLWPISLRYFEVVPETDLHLSECA
jgi:hypothetical protein